MAHRQIQVQKDTTQERVQFRVLPGGYSHASGVCPGATNLGPKRYRVPSLYCTIKPMMDPVYNKILQCIFTSIIAKI